jgi:peroxin-2
MVTTNAATVVKIPPTTDWQLAYQHAQQRIARLQEQRAREACSQSRISSFFGGKSGTDGVRPAFRVGQLDTELLDEELLELMKGQLWNGLKYFTVCHHPHPELAWSEARSGDWSTHET